MQDEIIFDFSAIILSIGIFVSMLNGLILVLPPPGKILSNRLLGILVLGMGIGIMGGAIMHSRLQPIGIRLFGISGLITFLYGPLLYMYVQSYIRNDFKLIPKHLWHLLPSLLSFIIQSRFLFREIEENHWVYLAARSGEPPWQIKVAAILIILHVSLYLFFTLRIIRQYQTFTKNSSSFTDESRFKWLVATFSILLIPIMSVIFSALIFGPEGSSRNLPYPAFGATGMIVIIHYLYLTRSSVFAGFSPSLKIQTEDDLLSPKYISSTLTQKQKERYHKQLLDFLSNKKPYLNRELTRDQLADSLNINSKYLSQVINELCGQNFMDFINSYRIEEAKEKLVHPAYQHFTILAIAQEVGFNSRSAFYSAFKKATGETPSTYKRNLLS